MISESLLSDFSRLVSDTLGLHFPKEGWEGFEKKLVSISTAFGFKNTADCLAWLMQAPLTQDQIATLAHYLTVGETYFFRDQRVFQCLQEKILPELLYQKRELPSIRIWSAACCTGEEPYSVAIALRRLIPALDNWNITILGTDLNPRFLQKAEAGIYKDWSFRTTSQELKDAYFAKEKDGKYKLFPEIRKMVQFMNLNLVEDIYPSLVNGTNAMDIIMCNNVLIYFNQQQIQKVVHKLTSSLIEGGWLIVSAIEVPYINDPRLIPFKWFDSTLFIKQSPQPKQESAAYANEPVVFTENSTFPPSLPQRLDGDYHPNPSLFVHTLPEAFRLESTDLPKESETKSSVLSKKDESPQSFIEDCFKLFQKGNYPEVIERLESKLSQLDSEAAKKAFTLLARAYANQGKLDKAQEWCEQAIKTDKLDPTLYFLQSTILQERNMKEAAVKSLMRALYLDQDFVMGHFSLGSLLLGNGKKAEAQRHFRNALQLLAKYGPDDVLPGDEELSAGRLAEIIQNIQIEGSL